MWHFLDLLDVSRDCAINVSSISGLGLYIGRLVGELNQLNLDQNTVIIYKSDNGYYMGNRGFAGKWSHYEESMRVPLIIYDPRTKATDRGGLIHDDLTLNVDIASTILDMANINRPSTYQGESLMPFVNGDNPVEWRNEFFNELLINLVDIPKWEGVRGNRYVYAKYFEQNPEYEFLHDLLVDQINLLTLQMIITIQSN